MTSLCRHLSEQEIVNWVTTADGCVHSADATRRDATQLDSFVASVLGLRRDIVSHDSADNDAELYRPRLLL